MENPFVEVLHEKVFSISVLSLDNTGSKFSNFFCPGFKQPLFLNMHKC